MLCHQEDGEPAASIGYSNMDHGGTYSSVSVGSLSVDKTHNHIAALYANPFDVTLANSCYDFAKVTSASTGNAQDGMIRTAKEVEKGEKTILEHHHAVVDKDGRPLVDETNSLTIRGKNGTPRVVANCRETTDESSASLSLGDKDGKNRAVPGCTGLVLPNTGEATMRPESSLVLFDKEGKVQWLSP